MRECQVDASAQTRCLATSGEWGQWLRVVPGESELGALSFRVIGTQESPAHLSLPDGVSSEGTKGLKSHAWGAGCRGTADDSSRKRALRPRLSGHCRLSPIRRAWPSCLCVSGTMNVEESGRPLPHKQDEGWQAGMLAAGRSQRGERAACGA